MTHLRCITRRPNPAQQTGQTTAAEGFILFLFAILFQDYDNFLSVFQNLQKFYAKTPAPE